MEEVECFRYLGVDIDRDGGMKSEMKHRLSEGEKVSGVLGKMWKGEGLSIYSKRGMYEGIVATTLLYGSEAMESKAMEKKIISYTVIISFCLIIFFIDMNLNCHSYQPLPVEIKVCYLVCRSVLNIYLVS
jgi:hypothetical protein